MQALLYGLLPRLLPSDDFEIHPFGGKQDLLKNLSARLRAYSKWIPKGYRIFVVIDRDGDDCVALKRRLEVIADEADLISRSRSVNDSWQLVNRIAIEELEAWYFGDWQAVREAYGKVPPSVPNQSRYRRPDEISGGTWEAFERVMKQHGYFATGLRKIEAAREIGARMEPARNTSPSFIAFRNAVIEAAERVS